MDFFYGISIGFNYNGIVEPSTWQFSWGYIFLHKLGYVASTMVKNLSHKNCWSCSLRLEPTCNWGPPDSVGSNGIEIHG